MIVALPGHFLYYFFFKEMEAILNGDANDKSRGN